MNRFRHSYSYIAHLPTVFWMVIVATLMNQIGNMAFVFLVLYATKHLGFSLIQATLCFGIFSVSMLLTNLFTGSLIDRIGAARMMIASLALNGCVLLCFPLVKYFPSMLAMCALWGFIWGIYRPASQTLVSHLSTANLHKITFSVYRLALNLGMSIGPAIGAYLAYHSFAMVFIGNGLANFAATLILFFSLRSSTWFSFRPAIKEPMSLSIKWLKYDAALRLFTLALIPIAMIFFQHESTLPVFLSNNLHLPLTVYGFIFTINTIMIVCLELPLNVLTLSWPYRINFMLGTLLTCIGFVALYFATTAWDIYLSTVIWTFGEMIIFPAASSYIADIAPAHLRGSYMSVYSMTSNLAMWIGPWAGAVVMQHFGAHVLWIVCGVWGLLSVAMFYRLPQPSPVIQS